MSLSALQLDAFHAVARHGSFSRAAKELHVTQSALSQRIKKLEEELGQLLFLRGAGGLALTDAGTRLLRYCQTRAALEADIVAELVPGSSSTLAGLVRIAGYSSVMRSLVLPSIAPLFRAHPKLHAELRIREMVELESMLVRAAADFVLLDHVLDLTAIGQNVTPEQWYGGLLSQTAQQFDLEDELIEFWQRHLSLGPLQRWLLTLRQVVLPHCAGAVVIFVDEIDAVLSLPFSTDEFFAGIRELYNFRTEDAALERRIGFEVALQHGTAQLGARRVGLPDGVLRHLVGVDILHDEIVVLQHPAERDGLLEGQNLHLARCFYLLGLDDPAWGSEGLPADIAQACGGEQQGENEQQPNGHGFSTISKALARDI